MNEHTLPDDLTDVEVAAAALGIAPSTLYRDIQSGRVRKYGSRRATKVSVAEARRAREDTLDPSMQRPAASVTRVGDYLGHRSDLEAVKAQKAALELAKMLGQTVDRTAVEEAIETAAREFRNALLRRWRTLSIEFEGLSAREIEVKGLASDEAVLLELMRKLEGGGDYVDGTELPVPADDAT